MEPIMKLIRFLVLPLLVGAAIDTSKLSWGNGRRIDLPNSAFTSTVAPSGIIYIAGGCIAMLGEKFEAKMGVFVCDSISDRFYSFDPAGNSFDTSLPPMPRRRFRHGAAFGNNRIWVFGGRDENDRVITEVDVYDINAKNWYTLPVTLTAAQATSDFGAFSDGSKFIFLAGGYDVNYFASKKLWRVDTTVLNTLSIREFKSMSNTRAAFKAVSDGTGRACVAGGYSHENDYCPGLVTVECYNLSGDTWTTMAPLTTPLAHVGLAAINGQLIVVGGEQSAESDCGIFFPDPGMPTTTISNKLQILDGDTWVSGPAPLAPRFQFGDTATIKFETQTKVYFIGGETSYDVGCECFKNTDNVMILTLDSSLDPKTAPTPIIVPQPPPGPTPRPPSPLVSSPTSAPTAKPTPMGFGCFSGDTTVEVKDTGRIHMKDLRLGDSVKVAANTYSEVYSFGHYHQDAPTAYLSIDTGLERPLIVTSDHMLFVGSNAIPASMVQVGDKLTLVDGVAEVKKIDNVLRNGIFAPFTNAGTIVVNDIVASSYVSLQKDSGMLVLAGLETFSMHWLAHLAQAPHRLMCHLSPSYCASETYEKNGLAAWAEIPLRFSVWLLQQHAALVVIIMTPAIALALLVSAAEAVVTSPLLLYAIVALLGGMWLTRSRKIAS